MPGEVDADLLQAEEEIRRMELALENARKRKEQVERERLLKQQQEEEERRRREEEEKRRQQEAAAAAAAAAAKTPTPQEIMEYEQRIEELKRQIAQAEAAKSGVLAVASQPPDDDDEYEYEEIIEYEEEIIEEEYEEYEEEVIEIVEEEEVPAGEQVPSTSAVVHLEQQTNPSARNYAEVRQKQLDDLKQKNKWAKPNYGTPSNDVQTYKDHKTPGHTYLVDKQTELKKKFQFQKPAWAAQNSADDTGPEIDNNPIQNPLLKKNESSGYSRQVFAKESLPRSQGTFVAPKSVVPPRLAWIVVDINKRKVGKIVLHLYGQGTDQTVEQFTNLVGMAIERQGKNRPIFIEGLDNPKFYITTNNTTKGIETKKDTYGIVQEGKEVIQAIKDADEHAAISIRQAHVYPVKKNKA